MAHLQSFLMNVLQISPSFDWHDLLLGKEHWNFLPEVVLRALIMFVLILISIHLMGKRGIKQLSVFELVVVIGLGSAASDPMLYKEVGIVPAFVIFFIVIGLYRFVTLLIVKNRNFQELVQGKPTYIIENGVFSIENFNKELLVEDEFFADLRMQNVSQLGQVESAIEEISGTISIFYYPDDEVKFGLPIMPDSLEDSSREIKKEGPYACAFCGNTVQLMPATEHECRHCQKNLWVKASNKKRIR